MRSVHLRSLCGEVTFPMKKHTLYPRPQRCQARQPTGADVPPLHSAATAMAAAVGASLMVELANMQRFSPCTACLATKQ